jgi:hypothetical protein
MAASAQTVKGNWGGETGPLDGGPRLKGIHASEKHGFIHLVKHPVSQKHFVEKFAGSAILSHTCAQNNIRSMSFEITRNALEDVACERVFHNFRLLLEKNLVAMLWLGITCASWSRARRGNPNYTGYPPPLRGDSSELIWGVSGLNEKDQTRVDLGNKLALKTVRYVKLCMQFGVPCVIENPALSRLWLFPPLLNVLKLANFVDFDHCQYGSAFRKPTKLACWNIDLGRLAKKCHCSKGICSKTQRPHIVLTGSNGKGFLTAQGSMYPQAFACEVMKEVKTLL